MAAGSSKKGTVAVLLILVAGGLTYAQMRKITPGASINNGHTGEDFGRRGQDRDQRFQQMARQANITPEQQKQIREVAEKGDWQEMRTRMQDILTTEQREKMRERREMFRTQQDNKMRTMMNPTEFKRYQEKQDERRGQWQERRNRSGEGNNR